MSALIKLTALMVIVGTVTASAIAQETSREGPFGLNWGSTTEQTKAVGVELKAESNKDSGITFRAKNLVKALNDQDFALLSYGFDDKLWRITAVSRTYSNDPKGQSIRRRYEQLVSVLTDKYGPPSQTHSLGDSIYARPENFLAGLNAGRSTWFSDFETPELLVQISIIASDSSTAQWRIIFENIKLAQLFDTARRTMEKDAFGPKADVLNRSESAQIAPQKGPDNQAVVRQKAVLFQEDQNNPAGKRFMGSAAWRTEMSAPGQPAEMVVRADIDIPDQKIGVKWSLKRNTDKRLPASYVVEIIFNLPSDFAHGGILSVPGVLMKPSEMTRGVPLAGQAMRVTSSYFLIGLSSVSADLERNIQLLKDQPWFDIPIVYNDGSRAIIAFEKGPPGNRVFADAIAAWGDKNMTKPAPD